MSVEIEQIVDGSVTVQESLEKTLCCLGISSGLQLHVHDLAILINSAPKVMLYDSNLCEHFVQKIGVAKTCVPRGSPLDLSLSKAGQTLLETTA